jgi:hypothetical protein
MSTSCPISNAAAIDSLPSRVVIPDESICDQGRHRGYLQYVRGTIEALAPDVELVIDREARRVGWSSFEIVVDDHVAVIDYSDFAIIDPRFRQYDHWFRFHHNPSFAPYAKLGSFPPWSFLDWNEYHRISSNQPSTALNDRIIYRHSRLKNRLPNLVERRMRAMSLLREHCGDRLTTGYVPQEIYFQDCLRSLAVVHIPGSHPHILDRTVQQMFGIGVCVISPDLWTTCLEKRPQANVHYVPIQDDYSDLTEKVDWVTDHPDQALQIGQAAKRFFTQNCTPAAIWRYIYRKVHA